VQGPLAGISAGAGGKAGVASSAGSGGSTGTYRAGSGGGRAGTGGSAVPKPVAGSGGNAAAGSAGAPGSYVINPYRICTWCRSGAETASYDAETKRYMLYSCTNLDADGCGTWQRSMTCGDGQTAQFTTDKDANGLVSQVGGHYRCISASKPPGSECAIDKDCGDAKKYCDYSSPRKCMLRDSWIVGTGTWVYNKADDPPEQFSWSTLSKTPSLSCDWALSTYWFNQSNRCTWWYDTVYFDAPEGGLSYVRIHLVVTDSTALNQPITDALELYTNTNASAHAGSVQATTNQVLLTTRNLTPGGLLEGTWRIAGTVGSSNVVAASGEFHIQLPDDE